MKIRFSDIRHRRSPWRKFKVTQTPKSTPKIAPALRSLVSAAAPKKVSARVYWDILSACCDISRAAIGTDEGGGEQDGADELVDAVSTYAVGGGERRAGVRYGTYAR